MEELKSAVTRCIICRAGKVSIVGRSRTKADLVIYGRSGMRLAKHLESRCMVDACRAGYQGCRICCSTADRHFLSDPGVPGPIYGFASLSLTSLDTFCKLN